MPRTYLRRLVATRDVHDRFIVLAVLSEEISRPSSARSA
jgi:hypothetical protein